jgi:hypothetical protein
MYIKFPFKKRELFNTQMEKKRKLLDGKESAGG